MLDRNYKDIIAGIVIAAMGLAIAAHAYLNLNMGTARQMGPGMVPFWLGLLLVALGGGIGVKGWREALPEDGFALPLRPLLVVVLAIGGFALAAPRIGVIPAVFLLVAIATAAESKLKPLGIVLLAAGLSAFCYLVFAVLLQLTLPMFAWRF